MPNALKNADKAVGLKQCTKRIQSGEALRAYIALDAEDRVTRPLRALCREAGVEVVDVESMQVLGAACGIAVGAAVAVLLR